MIVVLPRPPLYLGGYFASASSLGFRTPAGRLRQVQVLARISGATVKSSASRGTRSMSVSMMRRFGVAALKWALIIDDRWP